MKKQKSISTRVIDTTNGKPAASLFVVLEHYEDTNHDWLTIAEAKTDESGCIDSLIELHTIEEGLYRLTFDTDGFFGDQDIETFYSSISINFQIGQLAEPVHIPLALSPFGYSTFKMP